MVKHNIPFEVGQVVESRSFLPGFRGAWFRCKIRKIGRRNGKLSFAMEYIDFPDEKILWTKAFQRTPFIAGAKANKTMQMMVRPCFPPVYHKSEKPIINDILEVAVVAEDEWIVGDLVDWWTDGCYWSGTVSKILNDGMLQIVLPSPPYGEGQAYDVLSKDLRPSLDWSPDSGWTLPTTTVGGYNRHCAQLIKQDNEGRSADSNVAGETRVNISIGGSSSTSFSSGTQSRSPSSPLEPKPELPAEGPSFTAWLKRIRENSASVQETDSIDTISIPDIERVMEGNVARSSKTLKIESPLRLRSTLSNTLEDAVLDIEKLASHVRKLQNILKIGIPPKSSHTSLQIPRDSAPSTPK
ncbi:hypothetical protein SAY87_023630 [Trapa incisa]|uniref:Agenet domain-containing protein n=1 Tax=Trapa incisa TaxID=236973 RepID=A0AAN7QQJ3_9MYRT|nr:hypothetical protein SAY87_023630 [Trapa incisa]